MEDSKSDARNQDNFTYNQCQEENNLDKNHETDYLNPLGNQFHILDLVQPEVVTTDKTSPSNASIATQTSIQGNEASLFLASDSGYYYIQRHSSDQVHNRTVSLSNRSSVAQVPEHSIRRTVSLPQKLNSSTQKTRITEFEHRIFLTHNGALPSEKPNENLNPDVPPPTQRKQVDQAQQTRNVRFDKRRPQTLELRRNSSKTLFNDFHGIDLDPELMEEDLKLKRASLVIGGVATLIFLVCVSLVAITLHLTPELNKFASKDQMNDVSLLSNFSINLDDFGPGSSLLSGLIRANSRSSSQFRQTGNRNLRVPESSSPQNLTVPENT